VFDIARNMGTTVEIVEQYYGKDATPLMLATKLGG
jgi:integrase